MKKDIEWLKREIYKELEAWDGVEGGIDEDGINEIMLLINQFEESKVKQLERKIKELDSYNDELIRDNNQLRNELDNQEVLSQEWIENHSASADTISYYSKDNVPVVTAFNLKGLLMPKQEEIDRAHKDGYEKGKESEKPVEAVKEYFKSVEKSKEVLEELGYVVSEKPQKPMIPQFVADWIEEKRVKISDYHTETPERFFLILGHRLHYATLSSTNIGVWVFGGNEEKLYQALKYGYEVEKENKWVVKQRELYLKSFDIWREECNNAEFVFDKESTIKFTDKVKAEAVALLVDGTVEEVTE